jgi:vacuolar protein sorting-associated protein 53
MVKRKNEIDVKLLLYAIQKTVAFENLMAKTFNGNTIVQNYEKSLNNITVSVYILLIDELIIYTIVLF